MKQVNLSYAKADRCYYEAIRINKGTSSEWSKDKEGNALIDTSKTELNYELIPHHQALNPSNFRKHNRGLGIADYHKSVTGRTVIKICWLHHYTSKRLYNHRLWFYK